MAELEHLNILKKGVDAWNNWREAQLSEAIRNNSIFKLPDLSSVDLSGKILRGINFEHINLRKANLQKACFTNANFSGACLVNADLSKGDFRQANFTNSNLSGAILKTVGLDGANFTRANLSEATIIGATLTNSLLIDTKIDKAILKSCSIYGISAWGLKGEPLEQSSFCVHNPYEDIAPFFIDSIEAAQILYLISHNSKIPIIIDSATSKIVLILGRFTPRRKLVLDRMREYLRKQRYLPIVFDFDEPLSRNSTEIVAILANLSHFVIADLTEPSSVPHELANIIPFINVLIKPIIFHGNKPYSMFKDYRRETILDILIYKDINDLLKSFDDKILYEVENKIEEIRRK